MLSCQVGGWPVVCISIDPHDTAFGIPAIKARTLLIDIANGDNAPLAITRVASGAIGGSIS